MSLDQRLRDEAMLLARSVTVPPLEGLRRRATRRRLASIGAPLAVGLTVAAVVLTASGSSPHRSPAEPAGPRPVPAGMQAVDYNGVEVLVPASWKPRDYGRCGAQLHDTVDVLRPGDYSISALCLEPGPPRASLFFVGMIRTDEPQATHRPSSPQRPVTVDGHQAFRSVDHAQHIIAIPDRQVEVIVSGPSAPVVERLIAMIRVIDVDQQGCATRARLTSVGQLPAQEPTGAVLCTYDRGWSDNSRTLTSEQGQQLWRAIFRAPLGSSVEKPSRQSRLTSCALEHRRGLLIRFSYADRPSVTLVARLLGCGDLGVQDDRSSRRIDTGLRDTLRQLLPYPGEAFFQLPFVKRG